MTLDSSTQTKTVPSQTAGTYAEVVVPVDFTSLGWRVLPLAEQLGQTFRAPVRLLHVDTSSPWSDAEPETLRLRATPFRRPVDVQVVPDRDVAMGIARAVVGADALVVMGSHAHTGAGDLISDGSTDDILRALDGPVVLGGPQFRDGRASLQRVVCCFDFADPPQALLSDVKSFARALGLGIDLLTILPTSRSGLFTEFAEQERRLATMAQRFDDEGFPTSAIVLRSGRPGHEIVDYVNDTPGTVTALTTHARSAGARALVGSVGMKVVRHAYGPVLLRRREG